MIDELPDPTSTQSPADLELELQHSSWKSSYSWMQPAPCTACSLLVQVEFILNPPVQQELLVSPSELLTHTVEVAWHPERQRNSAGEWERKQPLKLSRGSFYVHLHGLTLTMTTKETKST